MTTSTAGTRTAHGSRKPSAPITGQTPTADQPYTQPAVHTVETDMEVDKNAPALPGMAASVWGCGRWCGRPEKRPTDTVDSYASTTQSYGLLLLRSCYG